LYHSSALLVLFVLISSGFFNLVKRNKGDLDG
jgi:hypothetical protein